MFELPIEPRVLDGQRRLGREGPEQLNRLGWEFAGAVAGHDETPDELVVTGHRHRQDGSDTRLEQVLPQPKAVRPRHGNVGHLGRRHRDGGLPDHPFPSPNPGRPAGFGKGSARLSGRPVDELVGAVVILEHHAAVQPRQVDGARNDGGQHCLQIERGADSAPDLAQRRELFDRLR